MKAVKLVNKERTIEKDTYMVNVKGIVKTDRGGYAVVVEIPFRAYDTACAVAVDIMGKQ